MIPGDMRLIGDLTRHITGWRGHRDSNPNLRRQTATVLETAVLPLNYAPEWKVRAGVQDGRQLPQKKKEMRKI